MATKHSALCLSCCLARLSDEVLAQHVDMNSQVLVIRVKVALKPSASAVGFQQVVVYKSAHITSGLVASIYDWDIPHK